MSPTVFAYIVVFTLLLAGAAAAAEWGTRGRVAARHFWTAAIVLGVLAPPGALLWHAFAARSEIAASAADGADDLGAIVVSSGSSAASHVSGFIGRDALIRMLLPSRRAAGALLSALKREFPTLATVTWLALSLALIAWLAAGVFHWRRVRRTWRRTTLDGVSVDVSPVTGPAVVGFLSHRIVLPAWATKMQPEHRCLVLAHECEHIDARDPERLAFAIAALILMPWNVGLWWCAARLRRSIELDCDARVLRRYPSAREYGYVLLEVAARGRNTGPLAIPMVALLRLPSELELRLRAMTRSGGAGMRGMIGGVLVGIIAVTAAFTTPVPRLSARSRATPMTTSAKSSSALIRHVVAPFDTGSRRLPDSLKLRVLRDSLASARRERAMAESSLVAFTRDLQRTRLGNMERRAAAERTVARRELEVQQVTARMNAARDSAITRHQEERRRQPEGADTLRPSDTRITKQQQIQGDPQERYFDFQVSRPAKILPGAKAPIYPEQLKHDGVGGSVNAEFVVDTTGKVEPGSVKFTKSTNPQFEMAVRAALPKMHFAPAEVRGRHVKQLIQQPFTFSLTQDQ